METQEDLFTKAQENFHQFIVACMDKFIIEQKKLMEQDKPVDISYTNCMQEIRKVMDNMFATNKQALFGQITREHFLGENFKKEELEK
jgi:hypothetical protein